ncbi:MAG: LmeA family phospholipid-binding protein [Microbacterium sp.]|uniref:LmeA family phospholipid-binding protein n=1 Tax=Microbacterium sp. TaxID=51671 RepID=UPI003F81FF70
MSTADSQPTLPLPDGMVSADGPSEPRRHRVWPWIVGFAIVAVLAVGAWFAAEAIARQIVTGVVQDQVRTQLSLPADQQIDVEIAGAVLPQLIGGTLDDLTVSSDDVPLGDTGVTGDVTVTARGIPVRGEPTLSGATAEVALDEQQLQTLLASIDGFPADTVGLAAPNVTMTLDLTLFGVQIPIGVALTPSAADGDIVLTPASFQLGQSEVGADALRAQFGDLADTVLRDWNVCIADRLPAGATLTGVEVDGSRLVADFDVDGRIATDPALQQDGTCA